MSRPKLAHTLYQMDSPALTLFPAFVTHHITELLQEIWDGNRDYVEDENEAEVTAQMQEAVSHMTVGFVPLKGSVESPSVDINKHILLWTASDHVNLYVYLGGSGHWISFGDHYASFTAIDPSLLPPIERQDRNEWWIMKLPDYFDRDEEQEERADLLVYRIEVVPESDMIEGFPDL